MKTHRPHVRQEEHFVGNVVRLGQADGAIVALETPDGLVDARVPGTVPGDRVVVKIRHVGAHALWGDLVEVLTPSPDRVDAPCEVVLKCGGCPLQMVNLTAQRLIKRTELEQKLGKLNENLLWQTWQPNTRTTGYRTRALMMTRRRRGRLETGFFAPGTDNLVPTETCVVQHPQVEQVLGRARELLDRAGVTTWRDADRPGQLRALLFRLDPAQRSGLLTLVVTTDSGLQPIADHLRDIPGVAGVFANIHTAPGGAVLGPETRHLAGATHQMVEIGNTPLLLGPTAFLQTRHDAAEAIVATLQRLLPEKMEHLLDLYAGIGVFGLTLRARCKKVTLVERDPAGALDASRNIERLRATHVHVREEAAETAVLALTELQPDAVVLDPPRAGCSVDVLNAIAQSPSLRCIIYVSCNATSLARDLHRLADLGWKPAEIVPIDMFPHTLHAEWVVRLDKVAQ